MSRSFPSSFALTKEGFIVCAARSANPLDLGLYRPDGVQRTSQSLKKVLNYVQSKRDALSYTTSFGITDLGKDALKAIIKPLVPVDTSV